MRPAGSKRLDSTALDGHIHWQATAAGIAIQGIHLSILVTLSNSRMPTAHTTVNRVCINKNQYAISSMQMPDCHSSVSVNRCMLVY